MSSFPASDRLSWQGYMPTHAMRFGGGGGGGSSAGAVAAPTPTPPITPANQAVIDIQQQTRREALRRKTISSTVYAGATGGWSAGSPSLGSISPVTGSAPSLGNTSTKTGG